MERRDLLKASAIAAATAAVPDGAGAQDAAFFTPPHTIEENGMKYRSLGDTGARVSVIGIGGYHLAKPGPQGPSEADAISLVRAAIDHGINFCDNCWDYNDGESELRMGKALRDGYRGRAFLMTKIDGRTAQAATAQLEQSLRRLQTDHLDLLQFHEVIRMNDADHIFAPGGALEAVLRARDAGKLRHIGFTGHKSRAIHKHMFDVAERHNFHFDTVQMPVNIMDAQHDSFQRTIFPIAQARKTAVLAMKTFGDHFILDAHVAGPIEMLHYSLSQPVAVVITGIDSRPILDQALQAVRTWQPMSRADQQALLARAAQLAKRGDTERYKVSHYFDGTEHNPQWLTQA
jgi:predicted aldo/keto reductase-like oxidoreductase